MEPSNTEKARGLPVHTQEGRLFFTWRAKKVSAESKGKERKGISPNIPFVREKKPRSW